MKRPRVFLWLLVPLLMVAAAGWMVAVRTAEDGVLAEARGQLDRGESETALRTLERLHARPFMSVAARRQAAALFFRLGEDRQAHRFLAGQRFDPKDPGDRELRELSERCQRATLAVERAARSGEPEERLRLLRAARHELPDSPLVLQQLVNEEFVASALLRDPEVQSAFEADLVELQRVAPERARELRQEWEKKLEELQARRKTESR